MGKTMREQLKFALSWWHTMGGDGTGYVRLRHY